MLWYKDRKKVEYKDSHFSYDTYNSRTVDDSSYDEHKLQNPLNSSSFEVCMKYN